MPGVLHRIRRLCLSRGSAMAGRLVYTSITSTRTGVGLGARGATRVKLGPPNSGIHSMRSRAAARDTTPERAGVSEISRVAGRATLSFLPTHRAQWFTPERRAEGLAPVALHCRRGAVAGTGSGGPALQRNFLFFASAGGAGGPPYPHRTAWVGATARLWRALLDGWRFRSSLLR